MKKFLLPFAFGLLSLSAFAELAGDGYYRVQNSVSKRYVYLLDDKGHLDAQGTSADVNALELYTGFLRASSDPSTIIYIDKKNNSGSDYDYDIAGQGTSIHSILDQYLKIRPAKVYDGIQSYYAYGTLSGVSKYLGDIRTDLDNEKGFPSVDAQGNYRLWYIHSVKADSADSYFGVAPTLTSGGKYYYPMFAGFPYAAKSEGVKFYIVSKVDPDFGVVVLKEVNGVVPAGTAVIVECSHPLASDNRLDVGASGQAASVGGNMLKGVYFHNTLNTHLNLKRYDKTSMRMLAVVDGQLRFVTSDIDYLPRNEAYLQLSGSAHTAVGDYKVMKEDEYNSYVASFAGSNPDGYYRIKNADTGRYLYMLDDKGSLGNNADVAAFELYAGAEKAASDPASVFYMKTPSGTSAMTRDLSSQNCDLYSVFGAHFTLTPVEEVAGEWSYMLSATFGGQRFAFGDSSAAGADRSTLVANSVVNNKWVFEPVDDADDSNCFGIAPKVTVGDRYYRTFLSDFPYGAASDDMKFYAVSKIDADHGVVVITSLDGVVPAGTPVIVECAHPDAVDNKICLSPEGSFANVGVNLLRGVWFDNVGQGHENAVRNDRDTFRHLASKENRLAFASVYDYNVARNTAYIFLDDADKRGVDTYYVLTEGEYKEKYGDEGGVDDIADLEFVDVYCVDGTLVRSGIERGSVSQLGQGVYIVRSGNASYKVIVH